VGSVDSAAPRGRRGCVVKWLTAQSKKVWVSGSKSDQSPGVILGE
jgi:hypothetical protein